jgi:hypothetical protein
MSLNPPRVPDYYTTATRSPNQAPLMYPLLDLGPLYLIPPLSTNQSKLATNQGMVGGQVRWWTLCDITLIQVFFFFFLVEGQL